MAKEITMKKLMTGVAAVTLFAAVGMSSAGAATRLSDRQMDQVTAGFSLTAAASVGAAHAYLGVAVSTSTSGSYSNFFSSSAWASTTSLAAGVGASATSGAIAGTVK